MKNLLIGIIIGSVLTTIGVGAADYLGTTGPGYLGRTPEIQLYDYVRGRQGLENLDAMRRMAEQNQLDHQLDHLKPPCR